MDACWACSLEPDPWRLALGTLTRQQIAPHSKHLAAHPSRDAINLPRILLHLPAIQQRLQPARLRGQLEQPLPLVLGQGGLLARRARRVLRLALLLPRRDLGLLARQRPLVVLVVVDLGVVRLDAVEQEVARLLEERVDAEVQRVVVGVERRLGDCVGGFEGGEGRGKRGLGRGDGLGELVEEGCDEVGVVDGEGELDEDVLVS